MLRMNHTVCHAGQRQVADFAMDYLDSLSTVPLAERRAELGQTLYSSLLPVLFPHMQYPQGFTTWDEWVDDDEEDFNRFRHVCSSSLLNPSWTCLSRAQKGCAVKVHANSQSGGIIANCKLMQGRWLSSI